MNSRAGYPTYALSRGASSPLEYYSIYMVTFGIAYLIKKWRRGRDSNPCGVAPKRFSRPPRYDHFDTSPYIKLFLLRALSALITRLLPFRKYSRTLRKSFAYSIAPYFRYTLVKTIHRIVLSALTRYDHWGTSPYIKLYLCFSKVPYYINTTGVLCQRFFLSKIVCIKLFGELRSRFLGSGYQKLFYKLDNSHLSCVSAAGTGLNDAAVTAVLICISRSNLLEELLNNIFFCDEC